MKRGYYFKFAAGSIRKNGQIYMPYILTEIISTAMFYIVYSMATDKSLSNMKGGGTVTSMLGFGIYVMIFLSAILLFFSNNFLMKRRKSEFGLYNVLGMEKRHIFRIILIENIITAAAGTFLGIVTGIIFNKGVSLLLIKMIKETADIKLTVSVEGILTTLAVFAAIYFVILLNGIRQIGFSNTIDLVKGSQVGEKEPKNKWLIALIGIILLIMGYYLSITIKDPIQATAVFFVAVILVICATYMIFTAGSIMLLKILKSNKKYYYKTNHFISVSGMMYRMKQNAVSLAGICILSTMVLVTMSATTTLYTGSAGTLRTLYPHELEVSIYSYDGNTYIPDMAGEVLKNMISEYKDEAGNSLYSEDEIMKLTYFTMACGIGKGEINPGDNYSNSGIIENVGIVFVVDETEYESFTGKSFGLSDNQVVVSDGTGILESDEINIAGESYRVKEYVSDINCDEIEKVTSAYSLDGMGKIILIVKDYAAMTDTYFAMSDAAESYGSIQTYYGMDADTEHSVEMINRIEEEMWKNINSDPATDDMQFGTSLYSRTEKMGDYNALYGGMYFVGIFLSIVFLLATILIIYYKQISEGYSDRRRYEIMQKVGLTTQEIKRSIHSQIITVFFLPLITAGIHTAFAVPMLNRILRMLGMSETWLFVLSVAGCFIVFAVIYIIVYLITSRVYYKIVSTADR